MEFSIFSPRGGYKFYKGSISALAPVLTIAAFLAGGPIVPASKAARGLTAAPAEGKLPGALRFSAAFLGEATFPSQGFATRLKLARVKGRENSYSLALPHEKSTFSYSFPQPFYIVNCIWPAELHCHCLDSQQYFPHRKLCLPTIHTKEQRN